VSADAGHVTVDDHHLDREVEVDCERVAGDGCPVGLDLQVQQRQHHEAD